MVSDGMVVQIKNIGGKKYVEFIGSNSVKVIVKESDDEEGVIIDVLSNEGELARSITIWYQDYEDLEFD